MQDFQSYLNSIEDPGKRERMENILSFIKNSFPQLKEEIKWNQPMFTDHGTFIIGFSIAKNHISVAPEAVTIEHFAKDVRQAGYSYTKELFRIKWGDKVDFDLLRRIVAYNIESKKNAVRFWR
ncbi:MAG TPA: iron chaperone [Clostridia bacterium]|nr:iron chaperone [Clostridia bacterium]